MIFQSLIPDSIDLKKAKLMRHNISRDDVARNYSLGYLDIYHSIQRGGRLDNCEYVFGFLGTEGNESKLLGCYKVKECIPIERAQIPSDYYISGGTLGEESVFYNMEKTLVLSDLIGRLVIDWGKSARAWLQNGATEKEVLYILPSISPYIFTSYDKVLLKYAELKRICDNPKENEVWKNRLSSVAGVYLITDTKTGKHYIGSASGLDGGIWGRWNDYAKTKHGGNKRLIELIAADPNHCNNFQFSILEVFPIKRNKQEILEYEALYKRKLGTIQFGLNNN